MEYAVGGGMVGYTAAGDMKLDLRARHTGDFIFPSCHYHGLTVAFVLDTAAQSLPQEVKDFPVTPEALISRWSLGPYPRVIHGAQMPERIFGELYRVPEKIRIPYFKVKILELLLCLDAMSVPEGGASRPYFYKTQAEKIKALRDFLAEHAAESFPQEGLSRRFDISMTQMKSCFRAVYGASDCQKSP